MNSPPTAFILQPAAGAFSEKIDIDFFGSHSDAEDLLLPGSAFEWSSDLDGALGTGTNLTVDGGLSL